MLSDTFKPSTPLRGYRRVLLGIFQSGRRDELSADKLRTYKRPDFNFWYELGRQDARVAVLRQYGLGGAM